MILADSEISKHYFTDNLIVPFNPEQLQPASYDVRLGNKFWVFFPNRSMFALDLTKTDPNIEYGDEFETSFLTLKPGDFILGVTKEKVNIPNTIVARLEGKSSLGRAGLLVHATAGFIDPGFSGYITLELKNIGPIPLTLRENMFIGQLSFSYMNTKPDRTYGDKELKSHYQNQPDRPVPFRKD